MRAVDAPYRKLRICAPDENVGVRLSLAFCSSLKDHQPGTMDNEIPPQQLAKITPIDSETKPGLSPDTLKILEALVGLIPGGKVLWIVLVKEAMSVKEAWRTILIAIVIVASSAYSVGARKDAGTKDRLSEDNRLLNHENQLLTQRNTDLQTQIAPILALALKEFPGEEINTSLKKIGARLELQDPLLQPLAGATATALVAVKSAEKLNAHFMDLGGAVALCRGPEPLIVVSSGESSGATVAEGTVMYRGSFNESNRGIAIGKPIAELQSAEYIEIILAAIPDNSEILDGEVEIILNGAQRFEFKVPKQTANGKMVFIRDLASMKLKLSSAINH